MKDRTNTLPRASHPGHNVHSVIPMPGRLLVDYYDWDLSLPYSVPLDEVATDTVVSTTGTITSVRRLAGGRVMVVLSAADGNSAYVVLNADVVRMTAPALYRGYRMNVRGPVVRTIPSQPAGIEGLGVQVEVV